MNADQGRECAFEDHLWAMDPAVQTSASDQTATARCRSCGVGYSMRLRATTNRDVETSLTVFPASGAQNISRSVIQRALSNWRETTREMEVKGLRVHEATPKILGDRS